MSRFSLEGFEGDSDDELVEVTPKEHAQWERQESNKKIHQALIRAIETQDLVTIENVIGLRDPEILFLQDELGRNMLHAALYTSPNSFYFLLKILRQTNLDFDLTDLLYEEDGNQKNPLDLLRAICQDQYLVNTLNGDEFLNLIVSVAGLGSEGFLKSLKITPQTSANLIYSIFKKQAIFLSRIPDQGDASIIIRILNDTLVQLAQDPASEEFQKIAAILYHYYALDFKKLHQAIPESLHIDKIEALMKAISGASNPFVKKESNIDGNNVLITLIGLYIKNHTEANSRQWSRIFQNTISSLIQNKVDLAAVLPNIAIKALNKSSFEIFNYILSLLPPLGVSEQEIEGMIKTMNLETHENQPILDLATAIKSDESDWKIIQLVDQVHDLTAGRKILYCRFYQEEAPTNTSIIELLTLKGKGKALDYLKEKWGYDIEQYLKQLDPYYNSYLHNVSFLNSESAVALLLNFGLDPLAFNIKGLTPTHIAVANYCQFSHLLIQAALRVPTYESLKDIKTERRTQTPLNPNGVDMGINPDGSDTLLNPNRADIQEDPTAKISSDEIDCYLDPIQYSLVHAFENKTNLNLNFLNSLILEFYGDSLLDEKGNSLIEFAIMGANPQVIEVLLTKEKAKRRALEDNPLRIELIYQAWEEITIDNELINKNLSPLLFLDENFPKHALESLHSLSPQERIGKVLCSNLNHYFEDPIGYMAKVTLSLNDCESKLVEFAKPAIRSLCEQNQELSDLNEKFQKTCDIATAQEILKEIKKIQAAITSGAKRRLEEGFQPQIFTPDSPYVAMAKQNIENKKPLLELAITKNKLGALKTLLLCNPQLIDERIQQKDEDKKQSITQYIIEEYASPLLTREQKDSLIYSALDLYRAISFLENGERFIQIHQGKARQGDALPEKSAMISDRERNALENFLSQRGFDVHQLGQEQEINLKQILKNSIYSGQEETPERPPQVNRPSIRRWNSPPADNNYNAPQAAVVPVQMQTAPVQMQAAPDNAAAVAPAPAPAPAAAAAAPTRSSNPTPAPTPT